LKTERVPANKPNTSLAIIASEQLPNNIVDKYSRLTPPPKALQKITTVVNAMVARAALSAPVEIGFHQVNYRVLHPEL